MSLPAIMIRMLAIPVMPAIIRPSKNTVFSILLLRTDGRGGGLIFIVLLPVVYGTTLTLCPNLTLDASCI